MKPTVSARPARGNFPAPIRITDPKVHEVNILDELLIEAGAFHVVHCGHIGIA